MPYKDIQKRRLAYRRWAEKNVDKRKKYQHILWLSKKANPNEQTCSIDGCSGVGERHHEDYSKPEEIIWICRFHHRREKHKGSCSLCGDTIRARGFCNKHYKSERKRLEPSYAQNVKNVSKAYRKRIGK